MRVRTAFAAIALATAAALSGAALPASAHTTSASAPTDSEGYNRCMEVLQDSGVPSYNAVLECAWHLPSV
ncbi:hypothetical protein [Streptomyces sp. KR80]|uniref:hypothetical protein n=1 Tax=Streptomyces sp. KR80 TaxID=3457426 RepID=UPI003FD1CA5F